MSGPSAGDAVWVATRRSSSARASGSGLGNVAARLLVLGVISGCGGGGDAAGLILLRSQVPEIAVGEPYLSIDVDGSCSTDCPPASISRGDILVCADLEAARAGYEVRLHDAQFESTGDSGWIKSTNDRVISVAVLTYDDAASGPQPTEGSSVSSAGDLTGACSLVVTATIDD